MDRYYLQPGVNVPFFVEDSIRKSNRIIVISTPNYKQKAEGRKGGVGREYSLTNTSLAGSIIENERIIPILRKRSPKESVVDFLRQYLYIDFSKDAEFESKYEELVRELYKEPEIKIPELGTKPIFGERKPIKVRPNPTPNPMPKEISKAEIRKLVIDSKVEQALDKMEALINKNDDKDTYNSIIILKSELKALKRKNNNGIISPDEASRTSRQITYRILTILNDM